MFEVDFFSINVNESFTFGGSMEAKSIGKSIKYLRKRAGFTQCELAEKLGVSDKAVSKWERGIGVPDISLLKNISIYLDVDLESLLSGGVEIHEKGWKGVILLNSILSTERIFDKPAVDYAIGYCMLAKIKEIEVICDENAQRYISTYIDKYKSLGIYIKFTIFNTKERFYNSVIDLINIEKDRNLMIIDGLFVLYGVNLTRFFQKAMANDFSICTLIYPCKNKEQHVYINQKNKIVSDENVNEMVSTEYEYMNSDIYFLKAEDRVSIKINNNENSSLYQIFADNNILYAEKMDKGFVSYKIVSQETLLEAANFVRSVQTNTGYLISDLEEIAYRRAFLYE